VTWIVLRKTNSVPIGHIPAKAYLFLPLPQVLEERVGVRGINKGTFPLIQSNGENRDR
jgi:hypothetical protein